VIYHENEEKNDFEILMKKETKIPNFDIASAELLT